MSEEVRQLKSTISEEPLDLASGRYLNESAIRSHALKCSQTYRAGRFTRVGEGFMNEVKADVESWIRAQRLTHPTLHPALPTEENTFTTGALFDRMASIVNDVIARIIQNKVQRQPSCGKTLSRTR